ncbi:MULTISPECIES: hypothetical protein [unclassified Haladaptatus]|uniref:hypothetical protein n=1 Tax=unclassified Haladaptatus TaxID=2622732 RepID=UPI00209C5089|nr:MULTISPECIES: hypothetical protein [unclassified Haladaptatus]MCO8246248.1 hypothetical protein [Haladaptatus sp. AB643]MCO8254131.1 hypothetical protein [Haladaptatus sp. AB618]
MATETRSRSSSDGATGELLAVAATILLASAPALFALYVIFDTFSPTGQTASLFDYATTTMSGAIIFAVLWFGLVLFAYWPSLAEAWNDR